MQIDLSSNLVISFLQSLTCPPQTKGTMKKIVLISSVLFLVSFLTSQASQAGDTKQGGKIYKRSCAVCHGDQGQGGIAGKINDPAVLKAKKDDEIKGIIANGVKEMPGFKETLKSEDIDSLVAFIRLWGK